MDILYGWPLLGVHGAFSVHKQNIGTQKVLPRKYQEVFDTRIVKNKEIFSFGPKKLSDRKVYLIFRLKVSLPLNSPGL